MVPSLERAKYTYLLAADPLEALPGRASFAGLVLSHSADMDCIRAQADGREALVLGLCVDAHGELARADVPGYLLGGSRDIESLCALTDRLAGRFVVLYRDGAGLFALTDAAATLHVNWADGDVTALSSSEQLLADRLGLAKSKEAEAIWAGSAPSARFLPGDMGMHSGVRFLLPNHYLSPNGPVRFFPRGWREPVLTPAEAAARIVPLVRSTARALAAERTLISGLTAGWDSRLVFALLREATGAPFCYTYINPGFTAATPDLYVPSQLSEQFSIPYEQIPREAAPWNDRAAIKALAGDWTPDAHINAAYTYGKHYPDKTYVGGALIDQIGRDHVADGLSHARANARTIIAATRNMEPTAWPHIRRWCEGADADRGCASLIDLFAWECLCGRWGTNPPLVHALAGNGYLNIFNCRDVLKLMLRVPSRKRFQRALHIEMYKLIAPELLAPPFNPPKTLKSQLQRTRPYTYAANHLPFALRTSLFRHAQGSAGGQKGISK